MGLHRACRSICVSLAIAAASGGPAGAWQTVVKPDFIPGTTLVIFGEGAGSEEAVTVSCIVDAESLAIVRLFIDVRVAPRPAPRAGATVTIRLGEAGADAVTLSGDLVENSERRIMLNADADAGANGEAAMLSWIKDLGDGGQLDVTIITGTDKLASFSVASETSSHAATDFLAACAPSGPAP